MPDLKFQMVISATAEVRDKDGNLISATPAEGVAKDAQGQVVEVTAEQIREMGYPVPAHPDEEKQS